MAMILFDYDGVLADTLDDLLQFGQAACDQLGVKHVVTREDLNNLDEMSFASYGRECGVPANRIDEFVEICLANFAKKTSPPAIFAGLSEVIRDLSANHRLAIVTTNTSQNVDAFLARHDLEGYFQAVYGIESPGSKVDKIASVQQLLEAENQPSVFMVGDSISDVLAARQASVLSIAVTWGHQSLEKLLRGNPDFVARSPQELVEIVTHSDATG